MHKLQNKKLTKKISGFTMIELIITLLIGSLLMAWAIPNYRDLKIRKQLTDHTNEMVYSLTLARAEAVRYGRVVTVEPTNGDWNDGWQITTTGVEGAADLLLYEQAEISGGQFAITQNGNLQGSLRFSNLGELVGNDEGSFTLTHTETSKAKAVRVRLTGLAKVVTI